MLAVSVGSLWEIAIKESLGKLRVPAALHTVIREMDLDRLEITDEHLAAVSRLPLHHRDPFDRLLICQASVERLAVVTADTAFRRYDVPLLDARA